MSPQCNADESQQEFDFGKHFQRQVTARFDGGRISSDGGAVLLGEVDRRLGLLDRLAACFQDRRDPERIEHSVSELVKQRVYAIALGYEDLNDHDQLRSDPLLALLAGKRDLLGAERQRDRDRGLVASLLLEGPEAHGFPTPLWTCPRIARLIADQFGVHYHEGHVWKILRALNWSPQRPVGKAREHNEEAIRTWQRKGWPHIKKKPANKAARSSSSTKAD